MQARTYRAAPDMRLKFLTLLQIAGGTTGLWISRSELAPLDLVEKLDQREAQKTCFFCLEKEEAAMAKIDVSSAGKDGFNSVPIFDEVTPLDERKRSVELSDEDKAHDYTQDLAELRRRFEAKKQAPKKKKAAAKPAKKAGGVKRKVEKPSLLWEKRWKFFGALV